MIFFHDFYIFFEFLLPIVFLICILFVFILMCIAVLFSFVEHSYNHSFGFFDISFTSLLLEFIIVKLLTFGGVMLPFCFYISFVPVLGFLYLRLSPWLKVLVTVVFLLNEVLSVFVKE
jgi:hypothetical protein